MIKFKSKNRTYELLLDLNKLNENYHTFPLIEKIFRSSTSKITKYKIEKAKDKITVSFTHKLPDGTVRERVVELRRRQ